MTKLPDVTDEPDDRKHVWATVHELAGVRLLYVDRQLIWNLIAHRLAEQLREDADLRATEGETELAAYGRALAHLIDPTQSAGSGT